MITQTEQQKISAAIAKVEQGTYAELVTVLARQADDYTYISTLWAALLALLTPGLLSLSPLWLGLREMLVAQWLVFIVLAVVLRLPFILRHLVPKKIAHWRASNLARRQFLENNLHHTQGESGLLIFVSHAEHFVEIIADRGISRHVPQEQWNAIVAGFIEAVKAGKTEQGFLRCIEQCGELLHQHCPQDINQKNPDELPNHLVML